jgi:hypothetical protein
MSAPVKSPSIETLFAHLTVADILGFVTDKRGEDLTLDFKLAPSAFDNRDDRKTLAEAISGFANSGGGLIVWGVEAKPGPDKIDCAQALVPIQHPDLFLSRLVQYGAAAASPVVDGVQHRLVEGVGGSFAVTYVPESSSGPHMAKLGEDRYFKRSGDRFVRMEHFDIADMFGRRPRPVLEILFTPENSDGAAILVSIANHGRGLARAPYLELALPNAYRASAYGADGNGHFGLTPLGRGTRSAFGGDSNFVIHPGQQLDVTRLEATWILTPRAAELAKGPKTFGYKVAAEGLPLEAGERTFEFQQ